MSSIHYRNHNSTVEERFWSKVDKDSSLNGCWLWTAYVDKDGYGSFCIGNRKMRRAHRFSYELLVSQIPPQFVIDHLCKTHGCVNPSHMRLVTTSENVYSGDSLWAVNKRKTHCKRGHPLNGGNLYLRHRGNRTERHCRTCRNDWMVQHRALIHSA
ncbi:hypothetical protein LCGC14_0387690 [marine sediment metagenome]|uniref:HNH nuclease domain-containing protein n=1 Tax=marine sediment metagenome TaxID=412755 RepID=A0A0F9TII3_9ZZZZ